MSHSYISFETEFLDRKKGYEHFGKTEMTGTPQFYHSHQLGSAQPLHECSFLSLSFIKPLGKKILFLFLEI